MQLYATVVMLVSLTACHRETKLTGDVFVVTKGRQNVKLALVDVAFVPEAQMTSFRTEKIAEANAAWEKAKPSLVELTAKVESARTKEAESKAVWQKHSAKLDSIKGNPGAWLRYYDSPYKPAEARHTRDGIETNQAEIAYLEAKLAAMRARSDAALFKGTPSPVVTAKTDADGRFTTVLKRGKYAVLAHTTRFVGGKDKDDGNEDYYWMVWLTVGPEREQKIMLSNDNQIDAECAECVFRSSDFVAAEDPKPTNM